MAVRNPLSGFALTILITAALSVLVLAPLSIFVGFFEFRVFFLGFALFGVGVLAGRTSYLGSLGFLGGFIGAFVGVYIGEVFFWWNTYQFLLAVSMALPSGLGGLVSGKFGIRRLERLSRISPSLRRCKRCGAHVGPQAEKCWSCKAALTL